MAKKTTIADLKWPFTVKRVTATQDENGDPVTVDESWSSFCDYKQMSTGTKIYYGLTIDTEAIEITYRYLSERRMLVNDIVTVLGGTWTHFGVSQFDDVGHVRYITQSLRRG